jgi:hypothetical protein
MIKRQFDILDDRALYHVAVAHTLLSRGRTDYYACAVLPDGSPGKILPAVIRQRGDKLQLSAEPIDYKAVPFYPQDYGWCALTPLGSDRYELNPDAEFITE